MGLAYEAIHPEVYPVALELLKSGKEKYFVAAKIYKQFAAQYDVPENEVNTAMIDLSISEAEAEYNMTKNPSDKGSILNREYIYKKAQSYYDKLKNERYENLELRPELEVPLKIRAKMEQAIALQEWVTVKSDGQYATLPHQYAVRHHWKDDVISFSYFAETIRQYCSVEIWKGTFENWAGRKGEYLRIGSFKYWTMGWPLEVTTVINRENPAYRTHDEYRAHPNEVI